MTAPLTTGGVPTRTLTLTGIADRREAEQFRRLRQRFATSAGCGVNLLIGTGNDSLDVLFAREEPNEQYGVMIQPSYDTAFFIASKSTTGFTVEFHNNAPANAYIDYIIFRTEEPLNSMTLLPASDSITDGPPDPTVQLTAHLYDTAGNEINGYDVTYTSTNPAVATVSATGLVTGVANGVTTIYARTCGHQATSTITVT